MYLSCETRCDIAVVVGELSRHNFDPRIGHLGIAKRVLHYLKGTITLGITMGNDPAGHQSKDKYGPLGVVGYADINHACDPEDGKSITGYCFFLGGAIVIWCSLGAASGSVLFKTYF